MQTFNVSNNAGSALEAICWITEKIDQQYPEFRIEYQDDDFEFYDQETRKIIDEYPKFSNFLSKWFESQKYDQLYRIYTGGCSYGGLGWLGFVQRTQNLAHKETAPGMWGSWKK